MATPYAIGTNVESWDLIPANTGRTFSAKGAYAHLPSLPSGTGLHVLQSLPETTAYAFKFFAELSGDVPAERTAKARIWGLNTIVGATSEYIGIYYGTVLVTTGSRTASTGVFTGTTVYFIKRIEIDGEDATPAPPGMRIIGTEAFGIGSDASGTLLIPTLGAKVLIVELERSGSDPVSKIGMLHRGV